jgi:hypothetical protein
MYSEIWQSLAAAVDEVNEAAFGGRILPKARREGVARWLAGRQGLAGAYAGMFAPTETDFRRGVRLFTGEEITTRAGVAHILGEEACRALIVLKAGGPTVREALSRASAGILGRLEDARRMGYPPGMYCCGTCSVALWRHLAAGGLNQAESRLAAGLRTLKAHRNNQGQWRRFPFYYTLLALSEIDLKGATEEIRFVAPICERRLKRSAKNDRYARRRQDLLERILARC